MVYRPPLSQTFDVDFRFREIGIDLARGYGYTPPLVANRLFFGSGSLIHSFLSVDIPKNQFLIFNEGDTMNAELQAVIDYYEREKGIDRETLIQAVENALVTASRKSINARNELRVNVDRKTL